MDLAFVTSNWYLFAALIVISLLIGFDTVRRGGGGTNQVSAVQLPQLINIIRGEMSLVGPRPIVENEIAKYGEYYRDYCAVRPGLTGLWQVEGRSDTTYEERVQLDVKYASSRTFTGDIMIMLRTVPAVLLSKGAR